MTANRSGRLQALGPGVLYAATAVGTSHLVQSTRAGASYGLALVLFILLYVLSKNDKIRERPGVLSGVFLIGYSIARGIVELFREPDAHIGFLAGGVTMGQLLSLPVMVLGLYLIFRPQRAA